jgi:hypothetical protein
VIWKSKDSSHLCYSTSFQSLWFSFIKGQFLASWGGTRLSPLGTSATIWPVVPAPDDRCIWSIWWNENWQWKRKYLKKTCPNATLSTTNATWFDLGVNLGHCSGEASN